MLGCCTVRTGYDARIAPVANFATKNPDDWARLLPDLLPAINQCVAREGNRAKVDRQGHADNAGDRCGPDGRNHRRLGRLRGGPRGTRHAEDRPRQRRGRALPGAGNPIFYPPRDPPPIVNCGKLERVVPKSGAVAGYLHYDPC